eukprot:GDKJ01015789.1.p1 GENE.GDKJ01015789.1~~GDKJ01015789.1.p1  ORF type:complete len:249 (-),score=39.17 GDKJ01015789.1:64-810(-)
MCMISASRFKFMARHKIYVSPPDPAQIEEQVARRSITQWVNELKMHSRSFNAMDYLKAQYIDEKQQIKVVAPNRLFERNLPPINSSDRVGRLMPLLTSDSLESKHKKWLADFQKDGRDARQRKSISQFLDVPRYPSAEEKENKFHPFFSGFSKGVLVKEVRNRAMDAYLLDRREKRKLSKLKQSKPWIPQRTTGESFLRPLLLEEMNVETEKKRRLRQMEEEAQGRHEDAIVRQWKREGSKVPSQNPF